MPENQQDRLIGLMSDGCWHSTQELVEKVGHRFSAPMHRLRQRDYKFEKRPVENRQNEYRLVM